MSKKQSFKSIFKALIDPGTDMFDDPAWAYRVLPILIIGVIILVLLIGLVAYLISLLS